MPAVVHPLFQSLQSRPVLPLLGALVALVALAVATDSVAQDGEQIPTEERVAAVETPSRKVLHEASVSYQVTHPLASFEGSLNASHIKSELFFDKDAPEQTSGLVTVSLLGFSSGNKQRDRHAQRSLETELFPSARLELRGLKQLKKLSGSDSQKSRLRGTCKADLILHGHRSAWPVEVELEWSGDELILLSNFTVLLDDFSIPRDKLFGMAIRNEVPVSVELRYRHP